MQTIHPSNPTPDILMAEDFTPMTTVENAVEFFQSQRSRPTELVFAGRKFVVNDEGEDRITVRMNYMEVVLKGTLIDL